MKRTMIFRALVLVLSAILLSCLLAVPALAGAAGDDPPPPPEFTPEEQAFIDSCGPLKVGFVTDRPPVSFADEDGALRGISRAVFDRLSQLTGLEFEYAPLPTADVTYDYLLGQGFDLVTSVEYNPENMTARGILMSDPYFTARKVVVAPQNLDFNPDAALSVAVSSGSQTIRKVLARVYPHFTITDYPSVTACFDAVDREEADLTILNQYVVEYWYSKPRYEDLKVIPVMGMDESLCFSAVVPFDGTGLDLVERGRTIISILNRGIAAISEDEISSYTVQAVLENQYELTFTDFLYRYRHIAIVLAAAAVIILALAILLVGMRVRSAEARADARAKSRFLSAMSHEIRTPLNGLVGLNHLMSRKLDDPQRLTEYLNQSTATAGYLLSLVDEILDVSSLRDRSLELKPAPVSLPFLLESCEASAREEMEAKGIDFTLDVQLPHPNVTADSVRLRQVILHLLDNARKFTPSGGRVTLKARQREEKGRILTSLTVADTGKGMSEEFQKELFDPFARELTDTVSKGNQGTGLGLAICRGLADVMGGSLTVESRLDEGSTFTFTFPAQPADQPSAAAGPDVPGEGGGRSRILVAEDNELNGEIMLELLEDEGREADLARDGKEALDMFSSSAPGAYGLILMDLLMPVMDGCQSAQAIRELPRPDAKTVRIVACTANDRPEDRDRALASGMDGFIPKPIDVPALLAILSTIP